MGWVVAVFLCLGCVTVPVPTGSDRLFATDGMSFVISDHAPLLITDETTLGLYRYRVWISDEHYRFTDRVFCPFGLPTSSTDHSRCLQWYHGIKVDGSRTLELQKKDAATWVYVFTASEQNAFRWSSRMTGGSSPYNMGGE